MSPLGTVPAVLPRRGSGRRLGAPGGGFHCTGNGLVQAARGGPPPGRRRAAAGAAAGPAAGHPAEGLPETRRGRPLGNGEAYRPRLRYAASSSVGMAGKTGAGQRAELVALPAHPILAPGPRPRLRRLGALRLSAMRPASLRARLDGGAGWGGAAPDDGGGAARRPAAADGSDASARPAAGPGGGSGPGGRGLRRPAPSGRRRAGGAVRAGRAGPGLAAGAAGGGGGRLPRVRRPGRARRGRPPGRRAGAGETGRRRRPSRPLPLRGAPGHRAGDDGHHLALLAGR